MSDEKPATSWWQTLPGVLTGIAAVITAVGGLVAVVHQSGLFGREAPRPASTGPRPQNQVVASASPAPAEAPKGDARQPGEPGQVRAGHYVFKVLATSVEPYAGEQSGGARKLALRLSIRVTDVIGTSDYVDGNTIRLSVDGAEQMPANSINVPVYERQSAETQALFVVPSDASAIALLLGRREDAVARLPLALDLSAYR